MTCQWVKRADVQSVGLGMPTARLMTRRSQVQILPPLPSQSPVTSGALLLRSNHPDPSCPRLAHGLPTRIARLLCGYCAVMSPAKRTETDEQAPKNTAAQLRLPGQRPDDKRNLQLTYPAL